MTIAGLVPGPGDTPEQLVQALQLTAIVATAIREAGEIPSGQLYALCSHRLGLDAYERLISVLIRAGLVERRQHLLRWIGPAA